MVCELIGLPGSGKTTLSLDLAKRNPGKIFCIFGKSTIKSRSFTESPRTLMNYLLYYTIIFLSIFFIPFSLIIFRNVIRVLVGGCRICQLTALSNMRSVLYLIGILNYQFTRYTISRFISLVWNKTILLDEGLIYNMIRFRTFLNPKISATVIESYIQSIYIFKIKILRIFLPPKIALKRFEEREVPYNDQLFLMWNFDKSKCNWREGAWREMDRWIDEISNQKMIPSFDVKLQEDNFYSNIISLEKILLSTSNAFK